MVAPPTVLTPEVRQGHVLQRDLLQETGPLAPRIPRHDLPAPQPVAQPGQPAVAIKGVGQQVAAGGGREKLFFSKILAAVTKSPVDGGRAQGSHSVDRVCSVSKAPGAMVVSWLS